MTVERNIAPRVKRQASFRVSAERERAARRAEADRRRAETDRRRAVADRRRAVSGSAAFVNRAPGIFSQIVSLVIIGFIAVGLLGISVNGNDAGRYFEGKTDQIDVLKKGEDGERDFYLFGATPAKHELVTDSGEEIAFEWIEGDHADVLGTVNWLRAKWTVGAAVFDDPITRGIYLISSFVTDEFAGALGEVKDKVVDSTVDGALALWDGWVDFWSPLLKWLGVMPDLEGG